MVEHINQTNAYRFMREYSRLLTDLNKLSKQYDKQHRPT